MIETRDLLQGITLCVCQDSRFKHGCLTFQLVRPMSAHESALNALLPAVLLRGTEVHRDLRAITEHLDTLYGASVSTLVRRVGDYQTVGLYLSFMDDRFTFAGGQVLAPMIAFLEELLFAPLAENGAFLPDIVESEKKNLIATIEAERNDKRAYAMGRLLREMCADDAFGLPRLGDVETVEKIGAGELYAHFQHILRHCPVEIFYVGNSSPDAICDLLAPLLARLGARDAQLPPQTALRTAPPSDRVEMLDVAQGKLCMGFTTPITNRDARFPAMQLLNTIFGAGMTSKLFMQVREKLSLCYNIGASYYGSKGVIAVSAGIDFENEQRTREEILHQMDACKRGDITPEELACAKEAVLSSLRATHDSVGSIESYYATGALSAMALTPEAYMQAIAEVRMEDVVAVANTLTLHSTYFLKGVEA